MATDFKALERLAAQGTFSGAAPLSSGGGYGAVAGSAAPAASLPSLTNVAQTWGRSIPYSAGTIRLAGQQVWSSDFYSLNNVQTDISPTNPASPGYSMKNPPVVGSTNLQLVNATREELFAIDVAYSFGTEMIPGAKRVLKKLRIDGTVVYDIDSGLTKFDFDLMYGDEGEQNPTIKKVLGDKTPYYPGQLIILIWGLVAPIPKDIDAEFSVIVGTFDGNRPDGRVLPAVVGTIRAPDTNAGVLYTYHKDTHTVRTYDLATLQLLSGPTACAPFPTASQIQTGTMTILPKFKALVLNDSFVSYSTVAAFDISTGALLGTFGNPGLPGNENTAIPVGPRGLYNPVLSFTMVRDSETEAEIAVGATLGTQIPKQGYLEFSRTNGFTITGATIANAANKSGLFYGGAHTTSGIAGEYYGNDSAFIYINHDIIKCETFTEFNQNSGFVRAIPYKGDIIFMARNAAVRVGPDGKIKQSRQFNGDARIADGAWRTYPQTDCGFFGWVYVYYYQMVNLETLELIDLTPNMDFALDSNSWSCGATFVRAYEANRTVQLNFPVPTLGGKIKLRDFIRACYVATGKYEPADIVFDNIDDNIDGALLMDGNSAFQALNDIRKVYRIEKEETTTGVRFYRTRQAGQVGQVAATIDYTELAALAEQQETLNSLISSIEGSDEDAPQITISFIDVDADYQANSVSYKPPGSKTTRVEQINLPLVLDRTTAMALLNTYFGEVLTASTSLDFRLPPRWNYLSQGDIIEIRKGEFRFTVKIYEDTFNADWSVSCRSETIQLVTSPPVSAELIPDKPAQQVTPQNSGPTLVIMLDIPYAIDSVVPPTNENYAVGYLLYSTNEGWKNGYLARYKQDQWKTIANGNSNQSPFVANAGTPLSESPFLFDYTPLTIDIVSGSWSDDRNRTRAELLANDTLNLAAYGAPGRWEIVQFQAIIDGKVVGILRGSRGTDVFTGTHQNGDKFVMLNAVSLEVKANEAPFVPETYRAGTVGLNFELQDSFAFLPSAHALKTWQPSAIKATRNSGDLVLSWNRRDRAGGGWKQEAPETDPSDYEVDIYNSAGEVVRTLSTGVPTVVYPAADQATDGFAPNKTKLSLAVYQIGTNGRGYSKRININVI